MVVPCCAFGNLFVPTAHEFGWQFMQRASSRPGQSTTGVSQFVGAVTATQRYRHQYESGEGFGLFCFFGLLGGNRFNLSPLYCECWCVFFFSAR